MKNKLKLATDQIWTLNSRAYRIAKVGTKYVHAHMRAGQRGRFSKDTMQLEKSALLNRGILKAA